MTLKLERHLWQNRQARRHQSFFLTERLCLALYHKGINSLSLWFKTSSAKKLLPSYAQLRIYVLNNNKRLEELYALDLSNEYENIFFFDVDSPASITPFAEPIFKIIVCSDPL